MNEAVEILKEIGLSGYEASAYVSLISLQEATAREISKSAGIPRTKVYEVLERLIERGFVEVQPGSPAIYRAIEPSKIIDSLQRDLNDKLETARRKLEQIRVENTGKTQHAWVSRGIWAVKSRIREFIEERDGEIQLFLIDGDLSYVLREINRPHRVLLYEKVAVPENVKNFRIVDRDKLMRSEDSFISKFAQILDGTNAAGVETSPKLLAISDNKSLLCFAENREIFSITINIPLVIMLQKKVFSVLYEEYSY
ncbi:MULTISPECIES: TrmB family transcriptional regulator [unclassified Archaeoglobus]|jgi:sugar-specific transcriptional regulator TrmB|uniref:TrmB family transcriptional regulator n=1 Tax=unclassified Archaeoglobus TaxID=2643606 RepID=UPI0025C4BFB1|nr:MULTISPECIES: helix-turn-helix domain-containing protein [unclassified Archaeoglobus]